MATGGSDSNQELADIVECPVCHQIITDPVTLPCSHNFCRSCIESCPGSANDQGQPGLNCPVCKRFHKRGEYINNFLIMKFLDIYQRQQEEKGENFDTGAKAKISEDTKRGKVVVSGSTKCLCCEKISEFKCLECKINLCKPCITIHSQTSIFRNHTYQAQDTSASSAKESLKDKDEISSNPTRVENNTDGDDDDHFCERHKAQKLQFYCAKCNAIICMTCKETSHKDHKLETIAEANQRLMGPAKELLAKAERNLAAYRQKTRKLGLKENELENHGNEMRAKVREESQRLIEIVRKQGRAAIESVEQIQRENEAKIRKAQEINRVQQNWKKALVDLTQAAMASAKDHGIMGMKMMEMLVKQLEIEEKRGVITPQVEIQTPVFNPPADVTGGFFNVETREEETVIE